MNEFKRGKGFETRHLGEDIMIGATSNPGYPAHFQDSVELFYLKSGNYKIKINNEIHEIHGGDLVVILPFQLHEFFNSDSTNQELVILLNINLLPDFKRKIESCEFETSVIRRERIPQQLVDLLNMFEHFGIYISEPSMRDALRKYLGNAIMWYVFQLLPIKTKHNGRLDVVQQVVQYIYNNYNDPSLSLEEISHNLGYNRTYLSNIVNSVFGMNFRSILNMIRIQEAKKLIPYTDNNLSDICHSCGFNSIRTFNRTFLRSEGMSPREYRYIVSGASKDS